jgi:hypothetical protein
MRKSRFLNHAEEKLQFSATKAHGMAMDFAKLWTQQVQKHFLCEIKFIHDYQPIDLLRRQAEIWKKKLLFLEVEFSESLISFGCCISCSFPLKIYLIIPKLLKKTRKVEENQKNMH